MLPVSCDLPDVPVLAVSMGARDLRALLHVPENGKPPVWHPFHQLLLECPAEKDIWEPAELCKTLALCRSLPERSGLTVAEKVLVCVPAREYPVAARPCAERPCLKPYGLARSGGLPLAALMPEKADEEMLRLCKIQRITGFPVLNETAATILGLLAAPGVLARSCRQGVTLVDMTENHVLAALVYQERLLGLLELPWEKIPSGPVGKAVLLDCLEEFRFGWLPDERARELGGYVDCAALLPPEAEGFRPIFASGRNAFLLEGCARIMDSPDDSALVACRGLLFGYARLLASTLPG